MENPGRFVAVRFVVRWGHWLPWLSALLCLAAGMASSSFTSMPGALYVLLGAAVAWGLVRLAVELVDLVAETLLPR